MKSLAPHFQILDVLLQVLTLSTTLLCLNTFIPMSHVIIKVHLSVSSRYQDAEGRQHIESLWCLNSGETEQMYSEHLSV